MTCTLSSSMALNGNEIPDDVPGVDSFVYLKVVINGEHVLCGIIKALSRGCGSALIIPQNTSHHYIFISIACLVLYD